MRKAVTGLEAARNPTTGVLNIPNTGRKSEPEHRENKYTIPQNRYTPVISGANCGENIHYRTRWKCSHGGEHLHGSNIWNHYSATRRTHRGVCIGLSLLGCRGGRHCHHLCTQGVSCQYYTGPYTYHMCAITYDKLIFSDMCSTCHRQKVVVFQPWCQFHPT